MQFVIQRVLGPKDLKKAEGAAFGAVSLETYNRLVSNNILLGLFFRRLFAGSRDQVRHSDDILNDFYAACAAFAPIVAEEILRFVALHEGIPLTLIEHDKICTVCHDPRVDNVCRLNCNHTLHSDCWTRWIISYGISTCPECRHEHSLSNL